MQAVYKMLHKHLLYLHYGNALVYLIIMKEHYHGHRDRLKKRFRKEPESLYDYEVVELLLGYVLRGRDVKPHAKELLEKAGGMSSILGFDPAKVKGWVKRQSCSLVLCVNFMPEPDMKSLKETPL